jgi:hypothetical protein
MKYTHVPGRMQPWDEFHESPCISPERDSLVENKNSDIKVICSDLHIFCHNASVQEKG